MYIGLSTIFTSYSIDVADLAPRAEEFGFESIWTGEQPILPVVTKEPIPREWGDIPDPFILLTRAAAVTTTIKLGTAVCVVTERHPITLAKEVATLDMYSGGRFLFGIGTGSHREEADIFGADFDHRWTQAREAVAAMKELWTRDKSEFHRRLRRWVGANQQVAGSNCRGAKTDRSTVRGCRARPQIHRNYRLQCPSRPQRHPAVQGGRCRPSSTRLPDCEQRGQSVQP